MVLLLEIRLIKFCCCLWIGDLDIWCCFISDNSGRFFVRLRSMRSVFWDTEVSHKGLSPKDKF